MSGCRSAYIITTPPFCPIKCGRKGKELWKGKLVHLLPSGGLVTTAPTVIQSTTPIKQKMAATTITIMSHHFISSKRGKNIEVCYTSQELNEFENSECCIHVIIMKSPQGIIMECILANETNKSNQSNLLHHLQNQNNALY